MAKSGAGVLALLVLLAAAAANVHKQPVDAPGTKAPAIVVEPGVDEQRPHAFTAATCDTADEPTAVEPDTPEAWADAREWCVSYGRIIDQAPWPSGIHPVP